MHTLTATIAVAVAAFVGTMIDNGVAFAAQLAITPRAKQGRATLGQLIGFVVLVAMSAAVGSVLSGFPVQWVGVLAVAPLALAVHAWRHRRDDAHVVARGAVTTGLVTIAFGGDNLAAWIPLFRAGGVARGVLVAGIFVLLDLVVITLARALARHPRVVAHSQRLAPAVSPFLYGALSIVILWQCQVL